MEEHLPYHWEITVLHPDNVTASHGQEPAEQNWTWVGEMAFSLTCQS